MANWCDAFTLESLPNFQEYDTLARKDNAFYISPDHRAYFIIIQFT